MSTKTKTSMAMKIVAIVLILASAAMLFLPWMKVAVNYYGTTISGGDILRRAAEEEGVSEEYFRLELRQEINDLSSRAQRRYGVYLDADTLYDTAMLAIRLSWSPFAMSKMLGNVKSLTPQFTQYVEMESGSASATFTGGLFYAGLVRIILLILLILTLTMAAVAVVCILTDHRLGALPYLVFALILLVGFIVVIVAANNNLSDFLTQVAHVDNEVASAISLRIGFGGILCAVLAILGFVALYLPIGKREPVLAEGAPTAWKCPHCGAMRKASEKFCLQCGAKRPEAAPVRAAAGWKCPGCGTMLRADQRFCLYCGTKRPEQPAPAPAPRAAAPAQSALRCAQCGTALKPGQKFCPRCGGKQPETAAASAPAPAARPAAAAGWVCPGCGAKLNASQKFCPRCGGKRPETVAAPAPAPAARPAAPAEWVCPGCGTKLSASQKFCYTCGAKKPEAPAPAQTPAPALKPRVCALCGAALREGMAFCPVCGTRAEEPKPAESFIPLTAEEPKPVENGIPLTAEEPKPEESYKPAHAAPEPEASSDPASFEELDEPTIMFRPARRKAPLAPAAPAEKAEEPAAPVTAEEPAAPEMTATGFQAPSDDDL